MGVVATTAVSFIILGNETCLECAAGVGRERWSQKMLRHSVSDYAIVIPVGAEASIAAVAEAAHAAGVRVLDWIESCTDRVTLVARSGMGETGTMTVATAGSVFCAMSGKLPIGHNIFPGGGGLPVGAFVTTDTGR
jgi:hypothetical protein